MRIPVGIVGCLVILSSTCLAQAPTWVQVQTKNSPPGRWQHGTAYDSVRGRTVIFGGQGFKQDTWEYDGKDWTIMNPKTMPPPRTLPTMVYDAARRQVLMFGGIGRNGRNPVFYNDTWLWDGTNWVQATPKNSPSPRWSAALAYDSARQRTVLFGGKSTGTPSVYHNDTWEWDGVNWTQLTTKNAPSKRSTNMVYDSARNRMVIFGGSVGFALQDTWEYDGRDWIRLNPMTPPSPRCCVALAYDPVRQRTVLFGGWLGYFQETWEYDGKNWIQIKPIRQPSGRYDFDLMVYDQGRNRMVMFGGRTLGTNTGAGDTWEFVAPQALTGSPPTISVATGGTQNFSMDAGTANSTRLYWLLGSLTGTTPGVRMVSATKSVTIPLNPDAWTDITISFANSSILRRTKGTFDSTGKAAAAFVVPKIMSSGAIGMRFHHAYLVYDAQNNFFMASNPVKLTLVK